MQSGKTEDLDSCEFGLWFQSAFPSRRASVVLSSRAYSSLLRSLVVSLRSSAVPLFVGHAPVAAGDKTFFGGGIDRFGALVLQPLQELSASKLGRFRINLRQ